MARLTKEQREHIMAVCANLLDEERMYFGVDDLHDYEDTVAAVEAERDAALALLREAREWIEAVPPMIHQEMIAKIEAVPPIHQEMIAKIDAMLAKIDAALGGEDALAESE